MVQTRQSIGEKSTPTVKPKSISKITIKKANLSTLAKPKKIPKEKKVPPGIPCITLCINGVALNPAEEVFQYIGNYLHYPISQLTSIDEVYNLFYFIL